MKKKWILPLVFTGYTIVVVLLLVYSLYQKADREVLWREAETSRQEAEEARYEGEKARFEAMKLKDVAIEERDKYEKLLQECASK